jgi:hypothetical protein
MTWPEYHVSSWREFLDVTRPLNESVRPFTSRCVYRGAADASWSLRTTLARGMGNVDSSVAIKIEQEALASFQAAVRLWPDVQTPDDVDERFDWWALMQHHGAPTRLLDWSRSLYVATYFAVETRWDADGAVSFFDADRMVKWYLRRRQELLDSNQVARDLWPSAERLENGLLDNPNAPNMIVPTSMSRFWAARMVAQQGHFTMGVNVLADHGDIIQHALRGFTNHDVWAFGKFVIPAALKPTFLQNLEAMNVTAAALFPNVDGFGRSIDARVRIEAWRLVAPRNDPLHFPAPQAQDRDAVR